jgi:hypothetical protein
MTLQVGAYIKTQHDTVAFGVEPFYSRIVKVNRVTVRVLTENGDISNVTREFAQRHLIHADDWHPEIAPDIEEAKRCTNCGNGEIKR